ncbi:MAG: ATP-dependent 6-phosphofructokinase [Candidatus Omnitrophica bacterium]|nr:ATP-dependent 6-phosphofructokinase [Candidatus Omnitrophota bacterium]
MTNTEVQFDVSRIGPALIPSPMRGVCFTADDAKILYDTSLSSVQKFLEEGKVPPQMEIAGPREKIYFDPSGLRCGIVTCGGLCPGLNDVIRSIVLSLYYHYGVKTVYGFRYGYEGLVGLQGQAPIELTPENVSGIHEKGGSFLGSSRGQQDSAEIVKTLERLKIGILFTLGGDGTLRAAHAIHQEIQKRGLEIGVIGIPKTIDNDISYVQMTFGFETAVTEAKAVVFAAHNEAVSAKNGIGLVKLMGRDSGFIAAYATLAGGEVNFCLVPEVPFTLDGLSLALQKRLQTKGHAVIVVAEGAGQDLMQASGETDASGNVRYNDIGIFLRDRIKDHFKKIGMEINLKYIDPSYTIRSVSANAHDAAFCLLLGKNAVHAGMAGRTDMVVAYWNQQATHVPISMAVSQRKKIDPQGWFWNSVIATTGQPARM